MTKNKKRDWKKEQSLFEIALLILASFSFSYFVYQSSSQIEKIDVAYNEFQNIRNDYKLGKISLSIAKKLIEELKRPLIPSVSAEPTGCCASTTGNELCAVVPSNECKPGSMFSENTLCAQTSFCKVGCCIDENEGTYDKNVLQGACKAKWIEDKNCNVPEARLGCCILGSSTQFVTKKQCENTINNRAQGNGSAIVDWRQVNELQCLGLSYTQDEGACMTSGRGCKFGTKQECVALTGSSVSFFKNTLCTAPELNSSCQKTEQTKCFSGKDGVYFVDSCGNRANIYDSSNLKDESYWTYLVSLNNSCNPASGNANSASCGNCNRFLGGICADKNLTTANPASGNFACRDTNCKYQGETYKNGESWCVYDGKVGDGDDVVGSRHWKYVCNQGEVQVEPCADYRNQICIQTNTFDVNGTNVSFKNSACIANNWRECINLNGDKEGVKKCNETLNCRIEKVNIADKFHFDICTPKYPGGFMFNNEGEQKASEQICGMGTQTCTVMYKQTLMGSCEVVANGDCLEPVFAEKMNDFCRKLGDCGLEANIEGKTTENYAVKGAPKLSSNWISKLAALAKPVKGNYAEVENYTKYLEAAGLLGPNVVDPEQPKEGGNNMGVYAGLGIAGIAASVVAISALANSVPVGGAFASLMSTSGVAGSATGLGASGAAFAGMGIAFGIGMVVGSMIGQMLGLSPIGSIMMAVGGGLALMGTYLMIFTDFFAFGLAGLIIGLVLMLISLFFGGAKCKPKKVTFTCKPWQAPTGGDDCKKCNDNPLKPCSDYRCSSLGAACKLINKGTTEEMCVADKNDGTPPIISPNLGVAGNTTYVNEGVNGSGGFRITNKDGSCVDAYTMISFGINTNEPAQCKYDVQPQDKFEDLSFDLGSNSYTYNHTTGFMLPDFEACGLNMTDDNLKFYIKCRDTYGHETPGFYGVSICRNKGQDRTPPLIKKVSPEAQLISFNSSEKQILLYTNEPTNCKWSKEDKEYASMENELECQNDCQDAGVLGYSCNATLPIESSANTFYFRCKDQPMLEEQNRSEERNVNSESFIYTLNKPEAPLSISGIAPNADFEVANNPATIKLRVQTSGGGQYPLCKYSFSGYENMIPFFTTYAPIHEQEFNLVAGGYQIFVECSDETGDSARAETNFELIHDTNSPLVARLVRQSGTVKFSTTENADCRYSANPDFACGFDFNNATSAGSGTAHSFSGTAGKKYYIKCKDGFGNVPDGCSIVVSPTI